MGIERPILRDIPGEFIGERILLRRMAEADASAMHDAIKESAARLSPWMPWPKYHETLDDTREYIRRSTAEWILRNEMGWGIFTRTDDTFLGSIGFRAHDWLIPSFEIGYWLRDAAEGHGYMREAVRLLTTYSFESLGAERVMIRCDARNTRSSHVPERLGYILEGCNRRDVLDTRGEPRDSLVWAMIPEDYTRAKTTWDA